MTAAHPAHAPRRRPPPRRPRRRRRWMEAMALACFAAAGAGVLALVAAGRFGPLLGAALAGQLLGAAALLAALALGRRHR